MNLAQNPGFESIDPSSRQPEGYELKGAAFRGYLGGWRNDFATNGIIFPGAADTGGAVSQLVRGIDQTKGRWISFRFRGLAEDGFSVPDNSLKMKIEFYSKNGTDYLDCASRPIYGEIELDRKNLTVNGDHHLGGAGGLAQLRTRGAAPFSRGRCGENHRLVRPRGRDAGATWPPS